MRGIRALLLGIVLAVAALPAVAAAKPKAPALQPETIAPAEQPIVAEAARRGALIYAYDQAAWHGTDDMLKKLPDAAQKVGGWIVDGPADSPQLIFFDRNETAPRALYVADFREGRLVSSRIVAQGEEATLSPARRAMVDALRTARKALAEAGARSCSPASLNTVVLPPRTPGEPTLVYFLTPQTEADAIPFGGHYLVPVDSAGKAGPVRAFAKSCLVMRKEAKAAGTPAALVVSHLLDPVPTEIHVFSSLAARLPVMVVTPDERMWAVAGSSIKLLGKLKR